MNSNKSYILYCCTFPNGKMYVGITAASLEERKKKHYSSNSCKYMHRALNKYKGQEVWTVIERNLTAEEARSKEKFLISCWETKSPKGYNLTDGGEGNFQSKLFYVFNMKGDLLHTFDCQTSAAKYLHVSKVNINKCLKGLRLSNKGYIFSYSLDISDIINNKHFLRNSRKPFIVTTTDNVVVGEWETMSECIKALNIGSVDNIANRLKGKYKSPHKGYYFNYKTT